MDEHDDERRRLGEVIADVAGPPMRQDVEGAVMLSSYVLVVEWMAEDGEHWLSRVCGPDNVTSWKRDGMLHHALNGDWGDDDGY